MKKGTKWCRCSVLPPGGRLAANITNVPLQESINLSPSPPCPRAPAAARDSCHAFDWNAHPSWRKFYISQELTKKDAQGEDILGALPLGQFEFGVSQQLVAKLHAPPLSDEGTEAQ